MVPSFAHPFSKFNCQLLTLQLCRPDAPSGTAEPYWKLILNQYPFLVSNSVPRFGREPDAVPQAIPMHILGFPMNLPHPLLVPRQCSAVRVLKKAIERDVASAHHIRFAIQLRQARGRIESELAHAESCLEGIRSCRHRECVKERVLRRPESASLYANVGIDIRFRTGLQHVRLHLRLANDLAGLRLAYFDGHGCAGCGTAVAQPRLHSHGLL